LIEKEPAIRDSEHNERDKNPILPRFQNTEVENLHGVLSRHKAAGRIHRNSRDDYHKGNRQKIGDVDRKDCHLTRPV
jgi:hypothetical protein